ncbi:MAG TPA: peptide chain release factor N(5)-glutamine methyltransferase [Acidimicrobiia bacterium]|nr:peptide chain release factor N(5)-glutamine methyltransferase [Acidimicrobiia bacterium]
MTDWRSPPDPPDSLGGDAGLPAHERLRLVAAVTGRGGDDLRGELALTPAEQRRIDDLVARRLNGEPLQYLEGSVAFGPVEVALDERVLIPRPETEYLFELVGKGPAPNLVVDLCTGSGALALALKHRFPSARVIGTDLSEAAMEVCKANGVGNGLAVEWLEGDLFDALPDDAKGQIDLLVSNPPYIAEGDWGGLPDDVRREPRLALVAGPTGMEVAERVLAAVRHWLAPSGQGWVEVGENQARTLARVFSGQIVIDQYGRDRFVRIDNA